MTLRPPRLMRPRELRRIMDQLEVTDAMFAYLVGVHRNTLSAWLHGIRPIPRATAGYIRTMPDAQAQASRLKRLCSPF